MESKEMDEFKNSPVSANYLRNKYLTEDLGMHIKVGEPINQLEIYGYEKGFNRAAKLFNKTISESNELIEFLKFIDSSTDWKENNDTTSRQVVSEYLKLKHTTK